jgi:uncharacterized Zn-binding protein involved in type VI secretion
MPSVSRVGDPTSCCSVLTGSPTTFADSIPIARVGADIDCCRCKPAPPALIIAGAMAMFADGFLVGIVGGADDCDATSSTAGSPTTFSA